MPTDELNVAAFWQGAHSGAAQRYTDLVIAGQGAYSIVASAKDTQTGEMVAIKRIAEVFYDAHEAKKVLREIRLLRDFCHPHIISLKELIYPSSIETFEDMFMVTDFMQTDLRRRIKSKKEMEERLVIGYMAQMLSALAHVHSLSGIHRDLKPANILISPEGALKLCDFGLARTVAGSADGDRDREARAGSEYESEDDSRVGSKATAEGIAESEALALQAAMKMPPPLKHQMTKYVVTRWYRAPEVILQEPYSTAIDIWSVGCIFKELLELVPGSRFRTGALFPGRYCIPFSFDDDKQFRTRHDQLNVIFHVLEKPTHQEMAWATLDSQREVEQLVQGFSDLAPEQRQEERKQRLADKCGAAGSIEIDLLAELLSIDPTTRPPASEVLRNHAYFANIPSSEKPPSLPSANKADVEAAFAFERENLNVNDLRILIANDLFRMQQGQEKKRVGVEGGGCSGGKPSASSAAAATKHE